MESPSRPLHLAVFVCAVGLVGCLLWADSSTSAMPADPPGGPAVAQPPSPGPATTQPYPGDDDRDRRPRRDERRHGRFGPHDGPFPPDEFITKAMEVIRDKLPEYHREMEKLRGTSPEKFEKAMMLVMPVVMEYLDLQERDQKLAETIIEEFKIEQELRKLSREYKKAADDQQKKTVIEQSLQQLVRRQFELKMQRQAARLIEFEKRLEKQRQQIIEERERLEEQQTNIDQLVTERIEEVKSGKVRNSFRLKELGPGGPGRPDGPPPGMGKRGPRGDGPPAMDDGHRPMPPPGFGGPRGHHPPPTSGPADEEWPTDDETPSDNEANKQP